MKPLGLCASLALLSSSAQAHAQTIVFSDDFDAENGGVGRLNYEGFAQWSVSDGALDLIGGGQSDFLPGNGLYLDLDGSLANPDAATLTSLALDLVAGRYELQFDLSYNAEFASMRASDLLDIRVAGLGLRSLTSVEGLSQDAFTPTVIGFDLEQATRGSIVFDHLGGDNGGFIIDNVSLVLIPSPGAVTMLGVAGLGVGRRRR
ncbi:MAG: hypothetical protein AAGG07_10560 [Planctomycetota bacterium]